MINLWCNFFCSFLCFKWFVITSGLSFRHQPFWSQGEIMHLEISTKITLNYINNGTFSYLFIFKFDIFYLLLFVGGMTWCPLEQEIEYVANAKSGPSILYHTFSHLRVIPLDLLYMFFMLLILHQPVFLFWFSTSHPTASEEGFLLGSTHISLLVDTSSSCPVSREPPPRYLSSLQQSQLSLVLLLSENLFWDYTSTHTLFR